MLAIELNICLLIIDVETDKLNSSCFANLPIQLRAVICKFTETSESPPLDSSTDLLTLQDNRAAFQQLPKEYFGSSLPFEAYTAPNVTL